MATNDILLVILGGGLGSACRYLTSQAMGRAFGESFPWGTLTVNLLGCFLVGFAVGLVDRSMLSRAFRIFAITGFLGGFTTFSTFSLESVRMILNGVVDKGILDLGFNVIGGFTLAALGLYAAARV